MLGQFSSLLDPMSFLPWERERGMIPNLALMWQGQQTGISWRIAYYQTYLSKLKALSKAEKTMQMIRCSSSVSLRLASSGLPSHLWEGRGSTVVQHMLCKQKVWDSISGISRLGKVPVFHPGKPLPTTIDWSRWTSAMNLYKAVVTVQNKRFQPWMSVRL